MYVCMYVYMRVLMMRVDEISVGSAAMQLQAIQTVTQLFIQSLC